MPQRAAKFVSAIFAGVLAGVPLATASRSAAPAAEDCLSSPNGEAPKGRHWYYRVDRATQQHCWYLRDQREKVSRREKNSQIVQLKSRAKPISPEAETAMQSSIADARAELPPQTRIEQPNQDDTPAAAMQAPAAQTQTSVIASRWPDPSSVVSQTNATPDALDSDTSVNSASQTQPPILAAAQLTSAAMSSETPTYSMQIQLAALIGALLLASIIASLIFRFGRTRRPALAKVRERRRVNWDSANIDHGSSSVHGGAVARVRPADFARDAHRADDADHRIAELLSQVRRRS
jgi:hypothetical protein